MNSKSKNTFFESSLHDCMIDSTEAMITIVGPENTIRWHNKSAHNFFGYPLSGMQFEHIFSITPGKIKNGRNIQSAATNNRGQKRILEHTSWQYKNDNTSISVIISKDKTDHINQTSQFNLMFEIRKLISRLAIESINISADEINSHLKKCIMLISNLIEVERCFIAIINDTGDELIIEHDWALSGHHPGLSKISALLIPDSWKKKKKHELIIVKDVKKYRAKDDFLSDLLFGKDLISALFTPVFIKNTYAGFIGFNSSRSSHIYTRESEAAIFSFADLISSLYEKKSTIAQIEIAQKIVSKSSGMLAYFDSDGLIKSSNEAFRKFHGLSEMSYFNYSINDLFKDSLSSGRDKFTESIRCALKGEEIKTEIWFKDDEKLRLLEIFLHPNSDHNGRVVSVIMNSNDITERIQLEGRILEVIHMERKKVGISLHDDLGHALLSVAIKSRLLSDRLKEFSADLSADASEIENEIKTSINEVRRLSHGLIPYKNHGLEFKEMIDAVALTIERDYAIGCEFTINKKISISDESIIKELYYIINEAIVNSIKHSGCNKISIIMVPENHMISLKIIDNGKGISEDYNRDSGAGLEIMKYRARAIGGFLEVAENPQGGTMIICVFNPEKINI